MSSVGLFLSSSNYLLYSLLRVGYCSFVSSRRAGLSASSLRVFTNCTSPFVSSKPPAVFSRVGSFNNFIMFRSLKLGSLSLLLVSLLVTSAAAKVFEQLATVPEGESA